MELLRIYDCLCDRTRLRLLHLLATAPLCVCHLQQILREPQVKISKHLAYLKRNGMVESERHAAWMIYRLPVTRSRELGANLACLQDCVREDPVFQRDRRNLEKLRQNFSANDPWCCAADRPAKRPARRGA